MNLRDASSGKILWQSDQDLSEPGKEHEGWRKQLTGFNAVLLSTISVLYNFN